MQIKEVMCKNVEFVKPDDPIEEVAQKMRDNNSGAILVGEEDKLLGVITDHDIAVKVIADGKDPHSVRASDVMHDPVLYCFEDQEVAEVADNMVEQKVLRLLVVDRNKRAKGVVAHSDIADAIVRNELYSDPLAQKVVRLASKIAA